MKHTSLKREHLRRVVVVGTSCSGKTTFARELAHRLGVQAVELDALHWQPAWTPAPPAEFRRLVSAAVASETWVLDGNYSAVRDILWSRATTLIWLNYPFPIVAIRALRRTSHRVFSHQVMWAGNRETFRQSFLSKDSILWWVITTYRRRRREYPRLFQQSQYQHLNVLVLTSPAEAKRLLSSIPCDTATGV